MPDAIGTNRPAAHSTPDGGNGGEGGRAAVGTVVGLTSTREFQMASAPDSVQLQDLVVVDDGGRRVWAKVGRIERLNPLFPREAAQELAFQGKKVYDAPFSVSREMVTAECLVVGEEVNGRLEPPVYPVRPASQVVRPDRESAEALICGGIKPHHRLHLGHLRGRSQVAAFVDAQAVVARHLGVLATTGAGKTVAVRRLIEELMAKDYPLLIFDPHGDYIGLHIARKTEVVTYLPRIELTSEVPDRVLAYLVGLSGAPLTEAQYSLGSAMVEVLGHEATRARLSEVLVGLGQAPLTKTLADYHFFAMGELADRLRDAKGEGRTPRAITEINSGLDCVSAFTAQVLGRRASTAGKRLAEMLRHGRHMALRNERFLQEKLAVPRERAQVQDLPPADQLHSILGKGRVAILSLEGYSDEIRQTIVAQVMEQLQRDRIEDRVPRFLTIVEEAHNFIPNRIDDQGAPSLPVLKQIASEGRKYGMGLVLVSQRPSRLDATVLSQCNSFMILRIVNPNDQRYVRQVVESLGEDEAGLLPDLSTGDALLSGQFVRFPVVVHVELGRAEGRYEEEDFLA